MTSEQKRPKARVLAYYLPQFHPIPENDAWWGKGFTEWTDVGKAKPLFPGHYQPHVPADLGYYDLRVPETREAQAQMAREAGVEGFVYWHYWFGNGKRLLERPFNEVLASGKPDFPFALAWANESWSGTLHGLVKGKMLIEQTYSEEDYIAHFNAILPAFKDHRYITCEGKPVFMVYRYDKCPDMAHFINLWQKLAKENGLKGIYFMAFGHNFYKKADTDAFLQEAMRLGFDGVSFTNMRGPVKTDLWSRLLFHINRDIRHRPECFDYDDSVYTTDTCKQENAFPTMIPNWDHTPRSGVKGSVMTGVSPKKFQQTVKKMVDLVSDKPYDKRFIFLKSWNEWGEGNYVEPDLKYGHGWLDALRNELF
ncbi:MAG: glycoside hydrolase family 99-like domain-containing protein [Paludibacteraceae bacterium]|nr:glycoside hydrolase family 99-like domain-containing protein [Paludibacteraceae bacterium]